MAAATMTTTTNNAVATNTSPTELMPTVPALAMPEDERVKASLERVRDQLADVLKLHRSMTVSGQIQLVAIMAFSNPKLAECDRSSLQVAVIRAASYGLNLDPALQEAFLIPRREKRLNGKYGLVCHFQLGYRGIRKLVLQSNEVLALETAVVYETDAFVFRKTPRLEFLHEPDCFTPPSDRGKIRGFYSHASLREGIDIVEVMSLAEVEAIRDKALAAMTSKDGWRAASPWDDNLSEMGRKTVLKRGSKSLPRSLLLDHAIADDDAIYDRTVKRVLATLTPSESGQIGRGYASLHRQIEAREAATIEPSFDVSAGVDRPLRSETDPSDYPDAIEPEDEALPAGRMPGED